MIDLHCHLLPGIDDGAKNMQQAVNLARLAVSNGITHAVVTPHMHVGRYENDLNSIKQSLAQYKLELKKQQVALKLGMAAEIRLTHELVEWTLNDSLPLLGEWQGDKVILLEMPHGHIPIGAEELIKWLLKNGIRPMIAHPERNKEIMNQVNKLAVFVDLGCLIQLTAGAVAGTFGERAKQTARVILENNWTTILASDAHNQEFRPPELEPGRQVAESIVGESKSWEFVEQTPLLISQQQFI